FAFERETREECYSLTELYQILIAPIEQELASVNRLLIIPHGILHAVPFHALRRPDGSYLIEHCTIAYAPSVAIAQRAEQSITRARSGAEPSIGFGIDNTAYLPLGRL